MFYPWNMRNMGINPGLAATTGKKQQKRSRKNGEYAEHADGQCEKKRKRKIGKGGFVSGGFGWHGLKKQRQSQPLSKQEIIMRYSYLLCCWPGSSQPFLEKNHEPWSCHIRISYPLRIWSLTLPLKHTLRQGSVKMGVSEQQWWTKMFSLVFVFT